MINVLLHELTHNVHSDHDANFKQLNSELGREYRAYMGTHAAGRSLAATAIAAPALEAATEDAGHLLGGGDRGDGSLAPVMSAREAAANAAAERFGLKRMTPAWPVGAADEPCACGVCGPCQECGEEVEVRQ